MEGRQPLSDCSKNFLESATPRGGGPLQKSDYYRIFKGLLGLLGWKDISDDSSLPLESTALRETRPQERETMRQFKKKPVRYNEESSELVTISKRVDSRLTWALKRMGLGIFFIV